MSLNRETILKAKSPTMLVETPEWGNGEADGCVFVRGLRGDDLAMVLTLQDQVEKDVNAGANAMVTWVLMSVCDEQGELLFTEEDRKSLLGGPLRPLMRCSQAAMAVSLPDVEETAKNSEATTGGVPGSG